jgi:hypothetical protein
MEDVTRKRVLRRLESLPEEQLYQVLDFIEFLEAKYARLAARKPDAFQQFAERVEDQMRVRSLAPRAMRGTMKVMSTAGKVLEGVRDLGRGLTPEGEAGARARTRRPTRGAARPEASPAPEPPPGEAPGSAAREPTEGRDPA